MNYGYIKSYRKIIDSPIFDKPKLFKVFHWCLYKASFIERKVIIGLQEIALRPGQFIYGRKSAARGLKMPESTVRNSMDFLSGSRQYSYRFQDRELDIKKMPIFSVVTIRNWNKYQGEGQVEGHQEGQQKDTNKNVKNDMKNVYISENKKSPHKQHLKDKASKYPERYVFNPLDGTQSSEPTEEEKKKYVPKIKEEYEKGLFEYMKKEGIENEDEVDPFKVETWTEYLKKRLMKIREKQVN